jgi:NAD(P)-dependent dehydrogenase (short-subunit alcohol dehydrogenase family)
VLKDSLDLTGRVAVVTGGSGGIGHSILAELAALGARCVLADLPSPATSAVLEDLERSGHPAVGLDLDVTDPEAVAGAMQRVAGEMGSLDILVAGAGIARNGSSIDLPDEIWRQVIDVNLTGCFWSVREAAKQMIKFGNGGSIVAIGSMSGIIANHPQLQSAYNASKAGVHLMVKSLAAELVEHHIRVNAVAPGYIDTPMTATAEEEWKKIWYTLTPMQRMGTPDEVARVITFLASDAASFVNGSIWTVDGGYLVW